MKYSVETIKLTISENPELQFLYFWGHAPAKNGVTATCLSQWYDVAFEIGGVKYHTAEQYMMAQKALLFNDVEVYDEIMAADNPKEFLLSTGEAVLVEASPYDKIWGIGMRSTQAAKCTVDQWNGLTFLDSLSWRYVIG